jgi:thiamine monophosphate synthase
VEAFKFRQGRSVAKIRGTRKLRRRPRKVVGLREKGTSETRKKKRPRKARRWLREGKVPCILNQEISFLGIRVRGL